MGPTPAKKQGILCLQLRCKKSLFKTNFLQIKELGKYQRESLDDIGNELEDMQIDGSWQDIDIHKMTNTCNL